MPSPILAVVARKHRSISLLRPGGRVDGVSSDVVKEAQRVYGGQLEVCGTLTRVDAMSLTACSTAEAR